MEYRHRILAEARMSNEKLARLLAELNEELRDTPDLDAGTRELLGKLTDDIERLTDDDSPLERARQLESRIAADYPVAERIAREIADALAKMGI